MSVILSKQPFEKPAQVNPENGAEFHYVCRCQRSPPSAAASSAADIPIALVSSLIGVVGCKGIPCVPCFHLVASISAWGIDVGQAVEIRFDDGLERLGRRTILEAFRKGF